MPFQRRLSPRTGRVILFEEPHSNNGQRQKARTKEDDRTGAVSI